MVFTLQCLVILVFIGWLRIFLSSKIFNNDALKLKQNTRKNSSEWKINDFD